MPVRVGFDVVVTLNQLPELVLSTPDRRQSDAIARSAGLPTSGVYRRVADAISTAQIARTHGADHAPLEQACQTTV